MKRQRTKNEPACRQVRKSYLTKGNQPRNYTYWVVDYVESGKRKKKQFKTEGEAKEFAGKFTEARDRLGERFFDLSHAQIEDAIQALRIRKESGRKDLTLSEAMRAAIESTSPPPEGGVTVAEVVAAYLEEARQDGLRPRSIKDLTLRLGRFSDAFGNRPITDIDRNQAETWLRGLRKPGGEDLAPLTKKNYRTVVSGLFSYAIDQEYVSENPFLSNRRRRRREQIIGPSQAPAVYSFQEAESILRAAEKYTPSLIPMLALGFFGGVRVEETKRMRWEKHIDLDQRIIFISSDVAKKRSTDNFEMPDALYQWLIAYRKDAGPITPQPDSTYESQRQILKRQSKVPWVHNGARHSFASYHFQRFQNRDLTMKILRHKQGSEMFDSHYKNPAVTKKQSERYFDLLPQAEGAGGLIPFNAAAT